MLKANVAMSHKFGEERLLKLRLKRNQVPPSAEELASDSDQEHYYNFNKIVERMNKLPIDSCSLKAIKALEQKLKTKEWRSASNPDRALNEIGQNLTKFVPVVHQKEFYDKESSA